MMNVLYHVYMYQYYNMVFDKGSTSFGLDLFAGDIINQVDDYKNIIQSLINKLKVKNMLQLFMKQYGTNIMVNILKQFQVNVVVEDVVKLKEFEKLLFPASTQFNFDYDWQDIDKKQDIAYLIPMNGKYNITNYMPRANPVEKHNAENVFNGGRDTLDHDRKNYPQLSQCVKMLEDKLSKKSIFSFNRNRSVCKYLARMVHIILLILNYYKD